MANLTDDQMRHARTCYGHIAGKLGLGLADSMTAHDFVVLGDEAGDPLDPRHSGNLCLATTIWAYGRLSRFPAADADELWKLRSASDVSGQAIHSQPPQRSRLARYCRTSCSRAAGRCISTTQVEVRSLSVRKIHVRFGTHDSREVWPRLTSGQDFTAAEVIAASNVSIVIAVLADGLIVGGFTFVLDPHLRWPPHEYEDEEREQEKELAERHDHDKNDRGRPRKIKFEIDLD